MDKARGYRPEHACVKMCCVAGQGAVQPCDYVCTLMTNIECVPCPFATIAEAASCGFYLEWDGRYVIGDTGKPGISGSGCWALAEAIVRSFWHVDAYTAVRQIENHWIGDIFIGRESW